MQTKFKKKCLSHILVMMLIVAMACSVTACGDKKDGNNDNEVHSTVSAELESSTAAAAANVRGQGNTVFEFTVVGLDGRQTAYEIHTDKTVVGDALQELGLIAGDESTYGLYVKTVDGITLDYNKDKKYWAFYVNGAYAPKGVDTTDIKSGETYMFKAE